MERCELHGFSVIQKNYFIINIMKCVLFLAGEDLQSLLFHLLDEFLFLFSAEPFFIARVSLFMRISIHENLFFNIHCVI